MLICMDDLPSIPLCFITIIVVVIAMEAGFLLGRAVHRRSEEEKESSVSSIEASILGLLAFMLAFTFGLVSNRFDERKSLVRQEANIIGTAYMRSAFLPEQDRLRTVQLLKAYVRQRLTAVLSRDPKQMDQMLADSDRTQRELWAMAVVNARKDLNSDIGALYIESLNDLVDVHRMRLVVGLQSRVPTPIWLVFYSLTLLGMFGVGYQTAIAGSKRTLTAPILALSFSLVLTLIAELDRKRSRYIPVPQNAMQNLLDRMEAPTAPGPNTAPADRTSINL